MRLPSLIFATLMLLVSCSHVHFDRAIGADEGNDKTVILSGCDQGVERGFLFCRSRDGASDSVPVTLIAPSVQCSRGSCVEYQFIRRDGSFGHAGSIPKGQNQAVVKLSDIIGSIGSVSQDHEGVYMILMRMWFIGPDKQEYSVVTRGIVYLIVNQTGYQSIGCNNPAASWTEKLSQSCAAQWTTAGRAALCGCE